MFVPDTPIALSDGTEAPICTIRPGDVLLSASGSKCNVISVTSELFLGDVIRIAYQDDGLILVTPDQFMATDRGKIGAFMVCPGERLCTPLVGTTGMIFWDVESTRRVHYSGHIWSLDVDGDGSYVAGGVIVS